MTSSSTNERLRSALLFAALLGAIAIFATAVDRHYDIRRWLVWRYGWYWLLSAVWATACVSAGFAVLDKLRPPRLTTGDRLALGFPLGVFLFHLAIFLVGLAGLLGTAAFVLIPLLFLAAGARHLGELRRHLLDISGGISRREIALFLFGVGSLALIYGQIIDPNAVTYDARWYHLPIAEQYARLGAVRAFPEGWWRAADPHLASYVYTWPFLLPRSLLFDRVELAVHLDFVVFVAIVLSVPALVRRFVPQTAGRFTWTVFFLFPGIFIFDANVNAGADHFAALWAIPVLLTLFRLWDGWNGRDCALFSVFVAGVLLTKYSAWVVLPVPLVALLLRGSWLALARERWAASSSMTAGGSVLAGLGLVAALVPLLTAPHWLTNWVWYGDPVYPVLHRFLRVHPWNPDAAGSVAVIGSFLAKPQPGLLGLRDAALSMVTFSFIPNDYWVFHRNVPFFGSLFTLSMLFLPMLRAGARLWIGYAAALVAVFGWFLLSHYDRYLQVVLPWMVACTAAAFILLWRTRSRPLQLGLVALIGLQLAWGADAPFVPAQNLIGDAPLRASARFAASGYLGTPNRLRLFGPYGELGESLPPNANVLVHDSPLHLGINARSVQDQWQGRISYAELQSPAAIQRELISLEVTHIMWDPAASSAWNCLAHDLAFWNFVDNHTPERRLFGPLALTTMPVKPAPQSFNDRVAMLTCNAAPYAPGWYRLGQLRVPALGGTAPPALETVSELDAAVEHEAGFLVVDPTCFPTLPESTTTLFHPPAARGHLQIYVRRTAATDTNLPAAP